MLSATTPGIFAPVLLVSLLALAASLYRRFIPLRDGRSMDRIDRPWERLRGVLTYVIFQKMMFRDPYAAIYHILIFWGFCVLVYRSTGLIFEGLGVHLPFSTHPAYQLMKDSWEVLVLAGVLLAIVRRLFFRPERLKNSFDAFLTLGFIALLMVTDLAADGCQIVAGLPDWAAWSPFSAIVAGWIPAGAVATWFGWSWWIHILTLFIFANFLPYSKHFHIYTSLFNVLFRRLDPPGKLTSMDLEDIDEESVFGIKTTGDMTWKQVLDLYTCTECGRCRELCPTRLTNKPLSPMEYGNAIRDHLYECTPGLAAAETGGTAPAQDPIVGTSVPDETVWACTTCRWCEHACPLFISFTDKIVDMRRYLVLDESRFPRQAQTAFKGMEVNGNPWNLPADTRSEWCEDLEVPLIGDAPDAEYLFWVGCAGSYEESGRRVSRAMVQLLRSAGVSFAILGPEETCTGDSARRLGNEYLFQMLAQQNVEILNSHGVKKIVTACPHCLNTLANEYPDFGGRYEVVHATTLLADLISRGRLYFKKALNLDLTYHDPCYLGRTGGVLEDPRYILEQIPGVALREMDQSSERGVCCGAGGGRMWLEEDLGSRINHLRLSHVRETGCSNVAVGCPYCRVMLDNASKEMETDITAHDVVELAAQALS